MAAVVFRLALFVLCCQTAGAGRKVSFCPYLEMCGVDGRQERSKLDDPRESPRRAQGSWKGMTDEGEWPLVGLGAG